MRRYLIIAAIALAAAPALVIGQTAETTVETAPASSELTADSVLGTTVDEVKAALTGMGYEVRKAEKEDGKIEVYFVKDKTMGEVYVSTETGQIVELEME